MKNKYIPVVVALWQHSWFQKLILLLYSIITPIFLWLLELAYASRGDFIGQESNLSLVTHPEFKAIWWSFLYIFLLFLLMPMRHYQRSKIFLYLAFTVYFLGFITLYLKSAFGIMYWYFYIFSLMTLGKLNLSKS